MVESATTLLITRPVLIVGNGSLIVQRVDRDSKPMIDWVDA